MNLQAALDQTAQIAGGGPTTGDRAGVYRGTNGITGIRVAYSLPLDSASLANDGVVHVSVWDGTERTGGAGDLVVYTHRVRMKLLVSPGRSDYATAYGILTPYIPLYETTFNAKLQLNGTAWGSVIEGYSAIGADDVYPDRLSLQITLRVIQKDAGTFAA